MKIKFDDTELKKIVRLGLKQITIKKKGANYPDFKNFNMRFVCNHKHWPVTVSLLLENKTEED